MPPMSSAESPSRLERRSLLALLFLVFVAHAGSLRTGYVYDDVEAILEHPHLRSLDAVGELFTTNYWRAERNIGLYRPLVQVSYLVDGVVFGFESPAASHAINLVLHLVCVWLLFGLLRDLGFGLGVRFVSGALFGMHPALLDAVVWISGRTDVLSALFVLAALRTVHALSRPEATPPVWSYALPGLFWLLGLLSKEMAATLPILLLAMPRVRWRVVLPGLVVAGVIYAILRVTAVDGVLPSNTETGVALDDQGLGARILIAAQALGRLLLLLPVPVGLAADHSAHPYASTDAIAGPWGLLAMAIYLHLAISAWRKRSRTPGTSFLVLAWIVALLPIFQIVPIGAVMAERFLYLPAAFLLPCLVILGSMIMEFRARRLLIGAALGTCLVLTWVRTPVYTDRITFSQDVIRAYPEDERAWLNLGVAWYLPLEGYETHEPDHVAAEAAFARALEIRPAYKKAWMNRARARLNAGDLAGLEPLEDWLGRYAERDDGDALYLLGKVTLREGQALAKEDPTRERALREAIDRYERAAGAFEADGRARRAAAAMKEGGIAARALEDRATAVRLWIRALELAPDLGGAAAMRRFIER